MYYEDKYLQHCGRSAHIAEFRATTKSGQPVEQTIRNYVRGVRALMNFHGNLPGDLEIDQVIDFLNDLRVEKERNWRTIKIYVAALRWYYQHMANQIDLAM